MLFLFLNNSRLLDLIIIKFTLSTILNAMHIFIQKGVYSAYTHILLLYCNKSSATTFDKNIFSNMNIYSYVIYSLGFFKRSKKITWDCFQNTINFDLLTAQL